MASLLAAPRNARAAHAGGHDSPAQSRARNPERVGRRSAARAMRDRAASRSAPPRRHVLQRPPPTRCTHSLRTYGRGSVESRAERSAKYAAATGKLPPYSVSSPARSRPLGTGVLQQAERARRSRTVTGERSQGVADPAGRQLEGLCGRRAGSAATTGWPVSARSGQPPAAALASSRTPSSSPGVWPPPRGDFGSLAECGAHEVTHVLDDAHTGTPTRFEHLRGRATKRPPPLSCGVGDDDRGADVHRLSER